MARWSKWKKRMEELICDELKNRLDIYATVYRQSHDQRGKVWIELDKKVIFEANTIEWEKEFFALLDEISEKQDSGGRQAWNDAEDILRHKNMFDEFQFYNVMKRYFASSFRDNLRSDDTLTRIFCLMDRRLGKRRLQNFEITEDDCDGIKLLYKVRCQIAGIHPQSR